MIRPFNFFRGFVGARVVSIGDVLNELYQEPPHGISHRHWNMLPQDLRGVTLQEMESFIQGWEDGRIVGGVNPYRDRTRHNLWNRGYLECNRRRRVYTERDMEYYNTDEMIFFDVTQVMFDPDNHRAYKFMLFRHIEEGNTVEGQRIYPGHPMYNFPDII
jgi:hypothetical protein